MSDHRAKVTKMFPGVPDGQVYPKQHVAGDIVTGDLARVAIEEKWADDISNGDDAQSADLLPKVELNADQQPTGGTAQTVAVEDTGAIEIPENWKTLKWPVLKALAEKISGEPAADSEIAKAIVETEIARRLPPQS